LDRLTVAICTRNRAASLGEALERLCALRIPADVPWEVVVIDNGSTDRTPDVIKSFAARLPIVSRVEPKPGVANARNTALEIATGEFVLWIDDDVLVHPGWIEAYVRGIRKHPEAVVFGGPVRAVFEGTPPAWLRIDEFRQVFCVIDFGPEEIRFDPSGPLIPLGSNYAIKRESALRIKYDPNLGPGSPVAPLGDETVLVRKVLRQEGPGVWLSDAIVDHAIGAERQTLAYVKKYFVAYGMTLAYLSDGLSPPRVPLLFGAPRWALRSWATAWLAYQAMRLTGDPRRWAKWLVTFSISRGHVIRSRAARAT
jgi:glycosyltransferase involved in cell wall biosynthesis